ncbi:ester cyclase [Halobaculum limi]|uniref:ester cyclase n=1 Tax=Halobaculum limi TaxID=3031916 RepID=UPI00240622CF|nr:ester cyclase [Halobaculum sp. YSMS11]
MSTQQDQNRETAERINGAFVDAYNTGATGLIDDVVTDDFVCHHLAAGQDLHGADGYKPRITELRAAIPDFHMELEEMIVEGNMSAGHYTWGGTHENELMGVPGTGKTIETTSMTMMRMEGDKMAEMWVYGDGRGLQEQLGITR